MKTLWGLYFLILNYFMCYDNFASPNISIFKFFLKNSNNITEAAHASRTHTVLEVFAYGGHFGKKTLHILFFCNKGNVYKMLCRKTNISFWPPCWQPFWKKKLHILFFCNEDSVYKFLCRKTNISFCTG